jgi:hypothetical protein
MRTFTLLAFALAAAAAGGCRTAPEATEQASLGVPQRDLTLQQNVPPDVEVASPVELGRAQPARPASHHLRRANRPEATPRVEAAIVTAAPEPAAASAVAEPVTTVAAEAEVEDPHALPPGRSVTVIPASSSPASDEGWTDQRPEARGRGVSVGAGPHGGGCKPRGGGRMPGREQPGAFR